MRKLLSKFIIVLFIAGFGASVSAQQSKAHRGLFLRAVSGAAFSNSIMDNNNIEQKYSGAAGFFQAQVGWALWDNLILFGSFDMMGMGEFDYYLDGEKQTLKGSEFKTNGVGAGVSYYFMPSNVYISLGFSRAETEFKFSGSDAEIESDNGWGSTLIVGKEWMLSDDWGLGVAGIFYYGVVPRGTSSMTNTYFGVAITGTFNTVESSFSIN